MIIMPGRTSVDFNATSVTRMMSMPGATSTKSDACPGTGRNPCATVPRNDANWG